MHLTPREHERLLVAAGADLARRRLARGAPLGATEAVALVCDEALELAWDGVPLEEVIDRAPRAVPRGALLPGVAALVPFVQVEALFPFGTVLVHVPAPFGPPDALDDAGGPPPGAVLPAAQRVALAPGRVRGTARLRNTGHAPVWVSSHLPLDTLNSAVEVQAPPGRWRADAPAGVSTRLDVGRWVELPVVALPLPAEQAPPTEHEEQS